VRHLEIRSVEDWLALWFLPHLEPGQYSSLLETAVQHGHAEFAEMLEQARAAGSAGAHDEVRLLAAAICQACSVNQPST
jgi:hypothetical protein